MNKTYLALACASALLFACSGEKQTTEAEDSTAEAMAPAEGEWIDLFDGETLNGWHKYGGGAVGQAWKVENGELYLDATNKEGWQTGDGGDIVTDEEFDNFHLKYEWKIAKNGNSGVIFYIHESDEYQYPWQTGPEMQVLDNDGHPDAKIVSHRAGDLYDLIVSSEEVVNPADQWNQAEIIANNGSLKFVMNGTTIVNTTMWTPEWEELIANSKFKDMPDFGTYKKGKIALQDHGDVVYFRNIKLKKL